MLLRLLRIAYARLYPLKRFPEDKKNYYGTPVLEGDAGNALISELIRSGKPCMISRFGDAEIKALVAYLEIREYRASAPRQQKLQYITGKFTEWNDEVKQGISRNAGFFPAEDKYLDLYGATYLDAIKDVDILGVWGLLKEDWIYHHYVPQAKLVALNCLEPYYFPEPWSQYLENKKVLVVHPFAKSIEQQYQQKRALLFPGKNILPPFELQTVRAVQSNANNQTPFATWFDALAYMQEEIASKDFDLAIIGAGAYGMPLASFVKRLGKQAIHLGGSVQILFGIRGARWDKNPRIAGFFNEHWVRPLPEETPRDFKSVEEGCYW